ncbi:ubiquitin-conjugating enzyme E2-17 kDa-like isoform X2 [Dysidea avara]|uniref:ubiquitin-conjugating enzyme E2-17 kDa-like isoform X2 n=1 Tax=Dysidea avara TaxID=196820 RepID=UPI00332111D7
MMTSTIRLRQELKDLHKSALLKSNGISVQLPSDSNIHLWNVNILAPKKSLYEGTTFKLEIILSQKYPFEPPKIVKFVHPIPYHLNVSQSDGQVCIGLLKPDQWDPSTSCIESILNAIAVTLAQPQLDSYVDDDVNSIYLHNRRLYEEKARCSVKK